MSRLRSESGFTMVATMLGTTVIAALALVAVTAVRGDINLTTYDLSSKRAYEAARAGVSDYAFHLYADNLYWAKCTNVEGTSPVNQQGVTTKRRVVPGDSGAEYAIELLPATGQKECSTSNPSTTMLESSGAMIGSFRIRSTGFVGKSKASIVTTFKRPSFLDYMYFTQLETSDPVSYGYANPSEELTGAYEQCELTYEQGRYDDDIPGTDDECNVISFISSDDIKGPLHTNDALAICGDPELGRSVTDKIEMGMKSPGWYPSCSGSDPIFKGTPVPSAPVLLPPPTNSKLAEIALPQFRYTGQVRICLSNTSMTVGTGTSSCPSNLYSGAIPSNGVVYVANGACSEAYSPFDVDYPSSSGCGNVYVKNTSSSGTFSGELTIAAENDIIINGNLNRSTNGILGLIANNFVRVYHPCDDGDNESGSLSNPTIDAAILAINHSFIVDNYNCGDDLGTLNVEGAIAQKFRGPVGTHSGGGASTGYAKNYVYDDRLLYLEPPHFIEPTGYPWVIGRETTD
jgi:type II secretory pathway pseudopilin PulG